VRNGLGTAALILGIASIPVGVLLFLPVLAIVFGIKGMRRADRGEATNKGMALTGTILGALGLLLGLLIAFGLVRVFTSDAFHRWQDCDRGAVTTAEHNTCANDLSRDLNDELFK
jgi:hypothetical protein